LQSSQIRGLPIKRMEITTAGQSNCRAKIGE
jgi:hypothetical protein